MRSKFARQVDPTTAASRAPAGGFSSRASSSSRVEVEARASIALPMEEAAASIAGASGGLPHDLHRDPALRELRGQRSAQGIVAGTLPALCLGAGAGAA
ncbi:hypothetical protein predicted by Glimmer/Critica [Sorangium cellulosum So ce56]|uniref:Uncharacterized protein n=1 Tax=Sorangium cellulosum (strain So ce56) TaxID=448385 RepID=A9G402_SORC5|nr:hypothetical protein predicted by Glimmer/Critica [Sorangium cellulosum So ce56]